MHLAVCSISFRLLDLFLLLRRLLLVVWFPFESALSDPRFDLFENSGDALVLALVLDVEVEVLQARLARVEVRNVVRRVADVRDAVRAQRRET